MYPSFDIAKIIINWCNNHGFTITNLKLQKLLLISLLTCGKAKLPRLPFLRLMNSQPNIFRTTRILSLSTFSSLEQTLSREISILRLTTSALLTRLNKLIWQKTGAVNAFDGSRCIAH